MKACVFTLGCKVNEVESEQILSALDKLGFETSNKLEPCDLFILNTCAVTAEAERKSRQLISRAKKFNVDAKIIVCGCASQKNSEVFLGKGADKVYGARKKDDVICGVCELFGGNAITLPNPKQVKSRAFVKIGDGCNNFCSYCVIPYLRGRVQNRDVCEIVSECEKIKSSEIVLTAINISAYENLPQLFDKLKHIKSRFRLGSLECRVIDENFLQSLKNLPSFAPQFHLSLQSGSNNVLKKMNRKYTREEYLEKCRLIYEFFPNAAITTDIIVGFPYETESDFLQSVSIVKEAKLAKVHVFPYSAREGTRAYTFEDMPKSIKDDRAKRLIAVSSEAEKTFIQNNLGRCEEVVFEQFDGTHSIGFSGNYIKTYVLGEHSGKLLCRLNTVFCDGVLGELAI